MKAMAFTEHGNIFEWVHKKEEIEKAGLKYLHGIEMYVTESLNEKIRDNYHCVLIAKNYEGVLELNELSSKSFNRKDNHFYYSPRISIDELINTSENIIITTACLGGILHNGTESVKEKFIEFLKNNNQRCFLEIQHHNDTEGEQKKYNKFLYELSNKINVPLVAGTDTHALNELHMDARRILQKAKNVKFADEDSWDMTFKTYDELLAAYIRQDSLPMSVVSEAIENTNRIADMVESFELDRSYKYPHLWENPEKTFRDKIEQGILKRGVNKYPNYQEYLKRIEEELDAYRHNGAIDFMLLMEDIIDWCTRNEIYVGYGRGSCNGSVIAWLLGITEMDSIKHKLNFQRFMNIERVSLSDIDTDFPPSRIDDVKKYIFSKTGLFCSDIITFNTIADKGAIRDIGRALGIALDEVAKICESVDDEGAYAKTRKAYPELFKYVDLVKGVVVSVGSHPCGTIVAGHSIEDKLGTFTTATSEYPISQINMKEVDSLNYVKLDLLKLDTIELINETCKLAGIKRLTPDNVDIFDIKVWNAIRDDTTQIFQWEGATGNSYIKKLLSDDNIKKFQAVNPEVDRMTLLSIGNSAIRPAGASYRDDLANGIVRKTGSVAIDEFLSSTFGYLVFQCQIIDFLHLYCGYTMGEADVVRRGFAKKTGTEQHIPRIKSGFVKTMTERHGYTKEKAEADIVSFIQVIEDASNYLFSLNHSQPYSYEGYVSGWLRTYYPLEFLTVALNINSDKEEKTRTLTAYAKKSGIEIKPPTFRKSKGNYFCDKRENCIYKGVGSLKFLNNQIADILFDLRNKKFDNFVDLLLYLKSETALDSRQFNILIEIEYFKEFGNINKLKRVLKTFDMAYDSTKKKFKKQISKTKIDDYGVTDELVKAFSHKETDKTYMMVDMYGMIKELETIDFRDISDIEKASYQQIILKKVYITDKKMKGIAIVSGVNSKYTPTIVSYAMANGNTVEFKVNKTLFYLNPLEEGDAIKIKNYCYRNKQRKLDNGDYEEIQGEKMLWVTDYGVIYNSKLRKKGE